MGKLTGFREFNRQMPEKRAVAERIRDYKELYIKMPEDKVREQGARCMDCGVPFCTWGCPLGNIIPDWNDLVYRGEWEKAIKRLNVTNNFPEFTGRICPAPCEGSCTLGVNRDAVTVRELECSIIEKAFEEGWIKPNPPKVRTGKCVAVVGSGPSGLAAAAELNSVGHLVTVFERSDKIGGLLRYGIPDFKLEKTVIDRRVEVLEAEGIKFVTNTHVGVDYPTKNLLKDFDAVVLTGGSTVPRDLDVEGRDLEGIHFAMDFLAKQNREVSASGAVYDYRGRQITDVPSLNAKDKIVLVLGGGDTGSDCIGTSVRQGAKDVYQYEIMPKPPVDRDDTMPWPTFPRTLKTTTSHEEGCKRDWNVTTKRFIGENGKVKKVVVSRLEWTCTADGRMCMAEMPGTEFELEVDLVLLAMGFVHPEKDGMLKDLGVELDNRGNVKADETFMTNVKGVFAAGDMRRGQSLVVWAINEGRQAAKNVDNFLMGDTALRG
jgi:glutamate synthase (NADPH/NADH) small chain